MRRILAGFGFALGLLLLAVPAWADDAEVGMVDGSSGEWHLREPNGSDRNFFYGNPGDIPLIGDWNCDGVETPGMFRPSTGFVYLTNGNPADNGVGTGEIFYFFGIPGDLPIAGDWDGDGCDSLGIYRNGKVFLRDKLSTGFANRAFFFGVPGDRPFAGDWDGDGTDTVGIYRNGTGQIFYTNENPWSGVATTANDFFYGVPSDEFIPGDWDGDGIETVGIYRPAERRFYLRNDNSTGPADETFVFGQSGWTPIGGDTELREATLTASTGLLDLGAVGLNGTETATLTVNFSGDSGDADLRITAVEFGQSGFDFSAAPLADPDIGFGENRAIEVSMAPTTLGVKRGFIRIRHTGVDSPLIVDLIGRSSYRINAGGDPIEDWGADSPFSPGGTVGPPPSGSVSGPTAPDEVFESYRFGQQAWDFPVTPGAYRVNLYFAETFVDSAGARLFDVDIEGVEALSSFDIYAAAGGDNIGIVRGFDVVSDANLDIDFTELVNSPAIQGIEVVPMPVWTGIGSTPSEVLFGSIAVGDTLQRAITVVHLGEPNTGSVNIPGVSITGPDADQFVIISGAAARTVTPGQVFDVVVEFRPTSAGVFDADLFISHSGSNSPLRVDLSGAADDVILYRLNTGGDAIVGQFSWSPDEAFLVNGAGNTGEFALLEAINTSDQSIPPGTPIDMIRTERFGPSFQNLAYALPVPNGPYEVRLYFVEGVHTAAGIRVFDVRLEGGLAINDLDIFARAGKNKAIMIPVQTNVTGGVLDIDLVPIAGKNLPAIHGIEVIKKEGNAFLSADPVSLTLGPIVTAGIATADVDISHEGGAGIPSIVIQAVSITGPGSSRFTLLSGPSVGDVLPPGTSDTAQIRFTPGVIGDKAANFNIQYNGGRVITVPLVGSVNNAPVMVNPGNRSGTEGVPFSVTATATDPDTPGDGDFRTMTADGVPDWATISAGDGSITISGTPGFADAGLSVVTLTVTDPDGLTDSESFTISIANFNRPPTFNDPLVNQTNDEGDVVSISTEATDLDGDDLTWSATGLPGGVTINPSSGLISGTIGFGAGNPDPGVFSVEVTVTDNGSPNKSVTGPFFWTVFDQNQPPIATPGLTATVLEGGSVVVTLTATDGDNDPLTFSAFAPVNGTLGSVVQGAPDQQATVTFTHDGSETTTASFQFNASDGQDTSGARIVNITVTPVNDPPVATPVITATVVEAGAVNVTLTASDPDGPTLTFNAFAETNGTLGPVNQGSLTDGAATVTFTHDGSETLSASFDFNATDGTATSGAGTVNITVTPQNDAPVATPVITTTMLEGGSVVVTLTASDGDGDPLTFNAFAPVNGSLGSVVQGPPDQQATVTFTHNGSETTTASFDFNASDGTATSAAGTVNITVTPVNDAPVVTAVINDSVAEGGAVNVTLTGSDPDGPTLTFSAFGETNGTLGPVNQGVLTDGQAVVTYTHNGSQTSSATFSFNATDGTSTSAAGTVNLTVTGVNDPPVPTVGITDVVLEGGSVVVTLTATDDDGDVLTFAAFAPVNGTLGSVVQGAPDQQATVTFTHDGSETTSASFQFNANDGTVTSGTAVVNLTVTPQNDAPTLVTLSSVSVAENEPANTVVGAFGVVDVDGPGAAYTLVAGAGDTDNGSFNVAAGNLRTSGSFDFETKSSYSIRAQVDDTAGGTFQRQFTISVTDVNDAPTDIALSSNSVGENQPANTVVGALSSTDVDGPTAVYSLVAGVGDADNGSFNIAAGNLRTSGPLSIGPYSVRVQVSDTAGGTFQESFTINVTNVNDPATDITLTPASVAENESVNTVVGALGSNDPDGPGAAYTLVAGVGDADNGSFNIAAGNLRTSASFDFETKSSYTVRVQVDDGAGGIFAEPVIITITDVNDAPTLVTLSSVSVAENEPANTVVGALGSNDPDGPGAAYTLVAGAGDTDNGSFNVAAGNLRTSGSFDFETKSSYSIRAQVDDTAGGTFQRQFTISVTDVNDAPTDITLTPSSVDEEEPINTIVGALGSVDVDGPGATFTLVAGAGDTDNGSFNIAAGNLRTSAVFDFETKSSYSIRVQVADTAGGVFARQFTVAVGNVAENQAATDITLTPASVAENEPADTVVGALGSNDPDGPGAVFTLVAGVGDADNGSFNIAAGNLRTSASFDFETKSSYTVRVQVDDGAGGVFAEPVIITVADVNDVAPTITASQAFSVTAGTAVGATFGTVVATDPDSAVTGFSISSDPSGFFQIDNSGNLSLTVAGNLAAPATGLVVDLTATDGVNASPIESVTIDIIT